MFAIYGQPLPVYVAFQGGTAPDPFWRYNSVGRPR